MRRLLALLAIIPSIAWAGSVTLSWDPVPDSRVKGYEVGYGEEAGSRKTLAATDKTTLTIKNISGGSTYFFSVRAFGNDRAHDSDWSNEVSTSMRFETPKNMSATVQVSISVN